MPAGNVEVQGSVDQALASRPPRQPKQRKPVDSGKGVRIQGGKVYDSKHGMTCHWYVKGKQVTEQHRDQLPGRGVPLVRDKPKIVRSMAQQQNKQQISRSCPATAEQHSHTCLSGPQ